MKKLYKFFSLLFILLLCIPAWAAKIKGKVIDAETGEAMAGANVFVKNTNTGSATSSDGSFSFDYDASKDFTLVVSFMGYKRVELELSPGDDLSNLDIKLETDLFRAEEIVVTGIASKTSKSVAEVAVSRVAANELTEMNSYQDLSQLVSGKVAGVKVEPVTGNVGGGIRFNMRSGGGINGDEQPVIIVDGVRIDNTEIGTWDPVNGSLLSVGGQGVGTLSDLNPEDIESIEVLKGPAGAASYGTNGSNGVVLINTRRGHFVPGRAKGISIDYKFVSGFNTQATKYTEDDFISYKSINKVFQTGPIYQHTLSAFGGSNLMKYYLGLDRRNEDGIIPNNFMERTSLRANLDVFPTDNVILNVSTNYILNENRRPNNDNNIFGFLGNTILTPEPWKVTDSSAVYAYENLTRSNRFIGSFRGQYIPFKNFEIQASVGLDEGNMRIDQTFPANYVYLFYPAGERGIFTRHNRQLTFTADARYSYTPLSDLKITSIVGTQIFNRQRKNFFMNKEDFLSELMTNIGAGETLTSGDEVYLHVREAGIFTDHSLNYKDQYFLSLALRQDYASVIGVEAPTIFYPRASLAIRLDRYSFMPSLFKLLKLRAAYGETGQLPTVTAGIPLLWAAEPSGFGVGAVLSEVGNSEIKPERIQELELGFETEFFNNYAIEFTYYKQKAKDSIIPFRNAPSTGRTASSVPINIGAIDGWGLESLLQAKYAIGNNLRLNFNLVNNYQTNEVKDLGGGQPIYDGNGLNIIKEGLSKHAFFSEKVTGALFNDDGTYAGPDVEDEKSYLGTPIPEFTGSFSTNINLFKNFNLYILSDWATGHSIFNMTKLFAIYYARRHGGPNVKRYRELEELLGQQDYADMDIQALTPGTAEYKAAADEYAKMDWHYDGNFIEKADYFKLREISISYSLKDLIPKYLHTSLLSDFVVGFSARNLWTTSKYSGVDVEINYNGARSLTRGQDFLTSQQPRVYNFWFRVSL